MPTHRNNKCKGQLTGGGSGDASWFTNNVNRQRKRAKAARKSRQVNRRRAR